MSSLLCDFIIHNTPIIESSDNSYVDAVWHYENDTLIPWIFSKSKSHNFIRQLLSGITNHHRLHVTKSFGVADNALSAICHTISPDSELFSSDNRKKRYFRRLLLTCRRNGGVFLEAEQMIRNFAQKSRQISGLFTGDADEEKWYFKGPSYEGDINDFQRDELDVLFRKDLGRGLNDIFIKVDLSPTRGLDTWIEYKGYLHSGAPVDITVFPPHRLRMMKIDMFPFRVLSCGLKFIPFTKSYRRTIDYYLNRVSMDLMKEETSRKWLKSLLPNIFPMKIPQPLPGLCSKHILVSSSDGIQIDNEIPDPKLVVGAAAMAFNHNIIFPDYSRRSVVSCQKVPYLSRASAHVQLTESESQALAHLITAAATGSQHHKINASMKLGLNEKSYNRLVSGKWGLFPPITKFSPSILAATESFCSLVAFARDSKAPKEVFEPLARTISKKVKEDVSSSVINYIDDMVRIRTK